MDHTPWGELEPSDEESSEEEEEEESDEEKPDETGFFTPADRYLTGLMVGVQIRKFQKKKRDQIVLFTFSVWVNNIASFFLLSCNIKLVLFFQLSDLISFNVIFFLFAYA